MGSSESAGALPDPPADGDVDAELPQAARPAAIAAAMGINPALLALPLGFSVSAAVLLPLDSVSLGTYQAGYYKMTDMFKPGLIISVAWVVITVAVMYLIARPLGLM